MANPWPDGLIRVFRAEGGEPEKGQPVLVNPLEGRGLVVIEPKDISSLVVSANFITGIDSTYNDYLLRISGLVPETDGRIVWLRVSEDEGDTWETVSYRWAEWVAFDSGVSGADGSTSDTEIQIGGTTGVGSTAGEHFDSFILFSNPASTTLHKRFIALNGFANLGSVEGLQIISGRYLSTNAINGVQILMASDGIASAKMTLYGLANS